MKIVLAKHIQSHRVEFPVEKGYCYDNEKLLTFYLILLLLSHLMFLQLYNMIQIYIKAFWFPYNLHVCVYIKVYINLNKKVLSTMTIESYSKDIGMYIVYRAVLIHVK